MQAHNLLIFVLNKVLTQILENVLPLVGTMKGYLVCTEEVGVLKYNNQSYYRKTLVLA